MHQKSTRGNNSQFSLTPECSSSEQLGSHSHKQRLLDHCEHRRRFVETHVEGGTRRGNCAINHVIYHVGADLRAALRGGRDCAGAARIHLPPQNICHVRFTVAWTGRSNMAAEFPGAPARFSVVSWTTFFAKGTETVDFCEHRRRPRIITPLSGRDLIANEQLFLMSASSEKTAPGLESFLSRLASQGLT